LDHCSILVIVLLTAINSRGVNVGKAIQNTFTAAKVLSLAALFGNVISTQTQLLFQRLR
jgi:amino acid transporter